ncbi:hypothetical protein HDV63DRAFT_32832 [Trichoderma sp. SZMC 28014]
MSTEMAQDRSDEVVSMPYVEGASLQLGVMQNYQDLALPQVISASIIKVLDVTMSSVMRVSLRLDSGESFEAVLKLYDRRFGLDLRGDGYLTEHWPLTVAKEALFESFVRRNDIDAFLTKLAQDQEKVMIPIRPQDFLSDNDDDDDDDDDDGGEEKADGAGGGDDAEKSVKYEAALWQECQNMFNCEVKAYEHLRGFQGSGIPRLLATVRLSGTSSIVPSDLINKPAEKYWDVKGILLQYIPGINLMNLDSSSIDVKEWEPLVQRSVDLAHEINKSGLVMKDCSPRNVIVHQQSQQPFIIDFAQCWLKHEMRISWETSSSSGDDDEEKEDDFILDDEYWDRAGTTNNPGAIGAVMTTRLKREKGVEIKIQYPDTIKLMVRPQDYYPDYRP